MEVNRPHLQFATSNPHLNTVNVQNYNAMTVGIRRFINNLYLVVCTIVEVIT
jgi:hypothetical protein